MLFLATKLPNIFYKGKLYNAESDYLAYRDNKNKYLKPNVSFVYSNKEVYYNYTPAPQVIYDYVDLGLPSGTKWATMNVGASKPSDAGLYFQWGDTVGYTADQVGTGDGKKKFALDWSDYKWNPSGDGETFSKYASTGATLEFEDDAANANMGGEWHMPTPAQIKELISNATRKWATLDGISGITFTSKKDASKFIFIPAAGYTWDGTIVDSGSTGNIWSSALSDDYADYGDYLNFYSRSATLYDGARYNGRSVRGVIG